MKMEIGHVIEVDGKEGTVIYTVTINEHDYILVTYEEDENKISNKIFEVKYEDNDFYVAEETNEELVAEVLLEFTKNQSILGEE